MKTKVIFRKYKTDNSIIAVFPEYTERDSDLLCYSHEGQHSSCNYKSILKDTIPAKEKEYSNLKNELKNIGYDLKVSVRNRNLKKELVLSFVDEVGDFVECNDCDRVMLLPCGADKCPICGSENLKWKDDNLKEITPLDLKNLSFDISRQSDLEQYQYLTDGALNDIYNN